jgi:hypothetical protein
MLRRMSSNGSSSYAIAAIAAGLAAGIALVILFSAFSIPYGPPHGNIRDVVITLERTRCFGACPDYAVTVYGNGTVLYEGRDFVKVKGVQTSQIPQSGVEELVGAFYKARFFSMRDRYEEPVSDLPSQTTSITIDGTATKTVYRYGFQPERLVALEDEIDRVAGTARWVK